MAVAENVIRLLSAGIEHAKATDDRAYLGRRSRFTRAQLETVRDILAQAIGIAQITKATGLTRQTVYRIKGDPAACEGMLSGTIACDGGSHKTSLFYIHV
jgi:putative DNA-invertase from lambdoid prophage Rac